MLGFISFLCWIFLDFFNCFALRWIFSRVWMLLYWCGSCMDVNFCETQTSVDFMRFSYPKITYVKLHTWCFTN